MKLFMRFYLLISVFLLTQTLFPVQRNAPHYEDVDSIDTLFKNLRHSQPVTPEPEEKQEYDSDSEDEEEYEYKGLADFDINPKLKQSKLCLALYRGIHFSPTYVNKQQRSKMRRRKFEGKCIYASAAYDRTKINPMREDLSKREDRILYDRAIQTRTFIRNFSAKRRNAFQQLYTNKYDKFHDQLKTQTKDEFKRFLSAKNPQVSTSEIASHAEKYAFGKKFLGKGVKALDPEYDNTGKPKHPYLGKLYIILIGIDDIRELSPYFVVHGYANKQIEVSTHFSNNILAEREVSFPGLIPGRCVVFSISARVPSFDKEYKPYYEQKYGLGKAIFNRRSKALSGESEKDRQNAIEKIINKSIEYAANMLEQHVKKVCTLNGISLVYKNLDDGFSDTMPTIEEAIKHAKITLN